RPGAAILELDVERAARRGHGARTVRLAVTADRDRRRGLITRDLDPERLTQVARVQALGLARAAATRRDEHEPADAQRPPCHRRPWSHPADGAASEVEFWPTCRTNAGS